MSVVSCNEIWDGRQGDVNAELNRKYTRTFRIITDDPRDGPVTVRLASGLPARYEPYSNGVEFDLRSLCREIKVSQDQDNPYVWVATVEYDSTFPELKHEGYASGGNSPDPSNSSNQPDNPLDEPPTYEWGIEEKKKHISKDLDDRSLVNSAQEPYDPPVEIDEHRLTLTVSKNVATFDPAVAIAYGGAVNTDTFFGAAAGKVRCKGVKGKREFKDNKFYWSVTYDFEFNRDGWRLQILDQGYREWVNGERKAIVDKSKNPVSKPALLDGNGHKLAAGGEPVYREHQVYPELEFAGLGLT